MADDWGPPFKVDAREVTFASAGVDIHATLLERERAPVEPPAEGKKPKKVKEGDPEAPPRAWCILLHGLLSDRSEFGPLPMALAREGFGVLALDLPGHGRSGGRRGIYSLETMVQVVRDAQAFLRSREEQWDLKPQQWGIIGHSTGGVVALQTGLELHAGDVIVAIATPRRFSEEMSPVRRAGYALLYSLRGGQNGKKSTATVKYPVSYKDIIADPAARRAAAEKGFLQTRIPLDNYPLLMGIDAEEIARAINGPTTLFVLADKDQVVSERGSRRVFEACGTAKELRVIEGSGHSVFLDAKSNEAVETILSWIKYRLSDFNEVRPGHTKR